MPIKLNLIDRIANYVTMHTKGEVVVHTNRKVIARFESFDAARIAAEGVVCLAGGEVTCELAKGRRSDCWYAQIG